MPDMDMMRRFAGVDPDSDTTVLKMCIDAAQQWYDRAGVARHDGEALYDFWVCNLAAWMYDNRGAGGADAQLPPFIVSSVHSLRALGEGKQDDGKEGAKDESG